MMCSRPFVAMALAGALSACAGGEPADGASGAGGGETLPPEVVALSECPPDTGTEPAHTDLTGIYTVPVPAELEPYAHYPIDSITACRRGALVELGYKLPALLVGKAQHVAFTGSYDSAQAAVVLAGDGTATCEVVDGIWSCLEQFAGITVDFEGLAEEVQGMPTDQSAGYVAVSEHFAADPIGILDFAP